MEVTVDSGAADSVARASRKATEDGEPVGSERQPDTRGMRCEIWDSFGMAERAGMKFSGADRKKRPLASVSAVVEEGALSSCLDSRSHTTRTRGTRQSIPMRRRSVVFVVQLDAQGGSEDDENGKV